ncbi:hypothetical protein B0J14DRAFT_146252 [Halenospora varia]|nr:hypothetical protein B0J14DRAFT_146252 [Halenospora varia]
MGCGVASPGLLLTAADILYLLNLSGSGVVLTLSCTEKGREWIGKVQMLHGCPCDRGRALRGSASFMRCCGSAMPMLAVVQWSSLLDHRVPVVPSPWRR